MSVKALQTIWENEQIIKTLETKIANLDDEDNPDVRKLRLDLEFQKGWLACLHHIAENTLLL